MTLRQQADAEQGMLGEIDKVTDEAQAAALTRQELPRTPGGTGGTGEEGEGQARGYMYSGETQAADLGECVITCTGLFSTTRLWYHGGEMHCKR